MLYIANWVYRYYFEGFYDFIAIVAGCVQTALYCDFFYLYITKGKLKLTFAAHTIVQQAFFILRHNEAAQVTICTSYSDDRFASWPSQK